MTTLRRNRHAEQIQQAQDKPHIGRCAIRVSYVGRRGKANEFGAVEQEFYSPDSQSDAAADYFRRKGIEYDAEASMRLRDLDRRARDPDSWKKREGLVQHLADAQQGKFTDIAFYKVSRLARNPADAFAVAEEFMKYGVTVHFVRDSLPPLEGTNGKIMLAVASTMAQAEAENIADNLSDAILQGWKKGKPHGPAHPWLKKVKNDYFIDENRFPVERRIIEVILQHRQNNEVVRALRAEDIKTAKGCDFVPAQISRYVSEIYIKNMLGVAVSGPIRDESGKDTCFEVQDAWPALITPEEADALRILHTERQGRMPASLKKREWGRSLGPEKLSRHPASGVLFCSICGKSLKATAGERSDNGHKYGAYFCDEGSYGNTVHGTQKYLQVSKEPADDAILRACYIEAKEPPDPIKKYAPPITSHTGLRHSSRIRADILAWGREYGQVPDSMFRLRAHELDLELKQAEEAQEALARQCEQPSLDGALSAVTNQEVAKRILITSLVKEALFPFTYENHAAIKVTMKSGRVYVCPVHRPTFKKERKVYLME